MSWCLARVALTLAFLTTLSTVGRAGPFDGKQFHGRIAYSADGNFNDEDDWAASPVALAIFAECGVKDKLVHFDYNCILPKTDSAWELEHATSVIGAATRYGYDQSVFHDCQTNLEEAVESIRKAINASSAEDPLYYILAGPMEVPYLGIEKSDPAKRQFVYCISHNVWNDGYASADLVHHNKRDVIPTGITWIQITDQNRFLTTSPFGRPARDTEWEPFHWMRDAADPNVRFLWDRMRATTRADCSDAGMAYFLMTGDEEVEIAKLKSLLDGHSIPKPLRRRRKIRLEAENFESLSNFQVEYKNNRRVSQRINVQLSQGSTGTIETVFKELYAANGKYNVEVRFYGSIDQPSRFVLKVNDQAVGDAWSPAAEERSWQSHTVRDVALRVGDRIQVAVRDGDEVVGRLDYVQFAFASPLTTNDSSGLDDPNALPGQIIVSDGRPGYLKFNGGRAVYLAGPDNPEEFLFRGQLNADGTRSGGMQIAMIERMAQSGLNAFHCQMFRMQRCNFKKEGDDQHGPFENHDPSQPLDEDVLAQWDGWLEEFERHGIIVHLEFYNDATDVEMMGWKLDSNGNLHPDEQRWIVGIVERFKHHKNIIWGLEESCNKLPRSRTLHFRKMAELIAKTDNHHHPIVQSFVVPNDPEGDFPPNGAMADDYRGDPHVGLVTWLHVRPHGADFQKQHEEYLHYSRDSANFVVLKNETFHHPKKGVRSRKYLWACAMTGMHCLEAYHHADTSELETLADHGRLRKFMEQTDFYLMKPHDELAAAETRWVLAHGSQSYIAYSHDCSATLGIAELSAGRYDLLWYDTATGEKVEMPDVLVEESGTVTWSKPTSIGSEVALYVKRRG